MINPTQHIEKTTAQPAKKKGFKQTEVGMIPEDWKLERIGNHFAFKNGLNKEKKFFGTGTPILNYMDVFENTGITKDVVNGRVQLTREEIKRYSVRLGDVFFTRTSETREEIGLSAVCVEELNNTVFSGFVLRARPLTSDFDTNFCRYCFSSGIAREQIERTASITTRALTNGRLLSDIKIPLPPTLTEQRAVATALSDLDALIEAQEQLIAKKRAIKQGAMQELLKPKEGWENLELGKKADVLRGGSPRPIESFLTDSKDGINWVKIGDVKKGAKYISSTEEKIKPSGAAYSRVVNAGDFLLSNSMSFGRPYILNINGCVHDGWLVIQNYQETFNTDFLYYVLGFESTLNQYQKLAAGSTVLNLNKEIVTHVNVPFPNKQEQTRIARILSDMDVEIEQLETQLAKYRQVKVGMMEELLTGKKRLIDSN